MINKYVKNYTENGLKVFPLAHNSKKPLAGSNGCLDATTDESLLSEMFQNGANVGIATGKQSALFVLDIDSKHDGKGHLKKLVQKYGALPDTLTVKTSSGGCHYYFLYPDDVVIRNSVGDIAPGIDVRGDGGYVVAPPSALNGKKYNFLNEHDILEAPEWLIAMVCAEKTHKSNEVPEVIQNGTRNERLASLAGTYRKLGFNENEICERLLLDNNQKCKEPLSDEEVRRIAKSVSRYERGKPHNARKPNYKTGNRKFIAECLLKDERGDAELFAHLKEHDLLYDHTAMKFRRYKNGIWQKDEIKQTQREIPLLLSETYLAESGRIDCEIVRLVKQSTEEAKKSSREKEKIRDGMRKRVQQLNRRSRSDNVCELVTRNLPAETADFDKNHYLYNILNGTYDFESDTFRDHAPADKLSKQAHVVYDPHTACNHWPAFLNMIFDNNQDMICYVQKLVGYSLTGLTDLQAVLFCHGRGANGKTTFFGLLQMLLGDYYTTIPIYTLVGNYSQTKDYHMVKLHGARAAIASEMPQGWKLDEGRVKDLTGGEWVTARNPHERPFSFEPTHKLWMFGNHKPDIEGTDEGIWRRIHLIPFNVEIPVKARRPMSDVLGEFKSELPGILNWAIRGYRNHHAEGIQTPEAVRTATSEYREDSDVLADFLAEECVMHDKCFNKDLFARYQEYSDRNKETPVFKDSKSFVKSLRERGFTAIRGTGNKLEVHGISQK